MVIDRRYSDMTERLHRLEQLYVQNPIYFVTCCTDSRKSLLAGDNIHAAFCFFAKKGLERNIFVGRYVLMPDHFHLFVKFSTPEQNLSDWIKILKNSLSKTLRENGQSAPHWQKGFFDHVLRSTESYSEKWLYIVENPVRAGLVKTWQDWPYQGEIFPLRLE